MLSRLSRWLQHAITAARTTTTTLHGIQVHVLNTRPDIATADVVQRLDAALGLIEQYARHHFRRMQRDFAMILVERYACRGAHFPDQRICLVELTFCVNPAFSPAQIAATILHEAMHARLHAMGFPLEFEDRARQERFCRRAEIEFGRKVPGGELIIERAAAAASGADDEVAPDIDPQLAAARIAEADRAATLRGDRSRSS